MALTCLCLVVLRDWNNLLEFIANSSFKIIYLLLGKMLVSLYVKANLLLFICMYSSCRSNQGYQQQGCAGTQAEGSPHFGCVRKQACGAAAARLLWDPAPLPAQLCFSAEHWDPQGAVVISHLATAFRAPRSVV